MSAHPLDRPVWHALADDWAPLAIGSAAARRIDPAYNVFGAAADAGAAAQAALGALVQAHGALWVVEPTAWPPPPGCSVARTAGLVQMTCDEPPDAPDPGLVILPLGEADAAEMRALARMTQPGPFAERTHRIGAFVGVRERGAGGRLIAMAGERMRPAGWAEVSGVCTHPEHRGRGLAAALMRTVARRILTRGERPWLTAYAANTRAIALYEALGFRLRRGVTLTVLDRTAIRAI